VASTRQVNSTVEYSGIHMVNLSWCVIKKNYKERKKKALTETRIGRIGRRRREVVPSIPPAIG
jgi:hypothetical protein